MKHLIETVINNVVKNIDQARLPLEEFGKTLNINEIVYAKVTLFVLRYIYNDKKSKTLAESRSLLWKKLKKKSTCRIPPNEDTMRLKILRCNYVVFMNLQYRCPNALESPNVHGWISDNGVFVARRYHGPALPPSLVISPTQDNVELGKMTI